MANNTSEGVNQFVVYEDEKLFYGIADVGLPNFESELFNVSGAGMLGEIEVPVAAYFKPMTVTINFRHANEAAYALAAERLHNLSFWHVDQNYNYGTGVINKERRKIIMRVFPKKLSGGTLKNASPIAVSGEYAVHYYAESINGVLQCEYDPLNFRYIDHSGIDRAAEIRKGLGMA